MEDLNLTELIMNKNTKILQDYKNKKQSIKVKQIDPATDKILNVFKNRYQAAAWLLDNGKTKYFHKSVGMSRACVAGALTISIMKNNPTQWGYKWELCPMNSKDKVTIKHINLHTGKSVRKNGGKQVAITKNGKTTIAPSLRAAALLASVTEGKIHYHFAKNKGVCKLSNGTILSLVKASFKKKPTTNLYIKGLDEAKQIPVAAKNLETNLIIKFNSLSQAAISLGVDRKTIKRSITNQKPYKNIQWKYLMTGIQG